MSWYYISIILFIPNIFGQQQQKYETDASVVRLKHQQQLFFAGNLKDNISPVQDSVSSNSWLTPGFLTADFNGDSYIDTAFAVIINKKKGIRIKHGNSGEEFIIGGGIKFGNGGDDLKWVETWNLVTDNITFEVTFMEDGDVDESRYVFLENPALYIGTEMYGGATVAWKENQYIWIHQAD